MEKMAFLDELKTLTANENILSVSRDVNELRTRFDDYVLEEERKKQVAVLDAKANGESVEYEREEDPIRDEFYVVYTEYKDKRTQAVAEKNALQADCLRQKKALISRLKSIIENEENIGAAFSAYKEIHEAWKQVGDIPREKRDEIQAEYSRLLEDFFYNMKIYRELKDHDLHRNEQVKKELITKIQNLLTVESTKEVEKAIKSFQNEWEETGPVGRDNWEEIKKSYLESVRSIYERINKYHDERRNTQQDNIEKKQTLLDKLKSVVSELSELKTTKSWEEKTQEVFDIQNIWKTIGFGPKKENEEIWTLFRAECDAFFALKKEFFDALRNEFDALAEAKQKLIDQANALKTSTDWKGAGEQLISLQKKWKNIGNAGQRNEQRLWKEFRSACDEFFNAKTAHFADLDKLNESNLSIKQELIARIEGYAIPEDKKQAISDLKNFSNEFNAIGHVPSAQKDSIYAAYKAAIDKLYTALKLEGQEKEQVMFQARLDTFQASPNAAKLLDKEKMDLRRQIDVLKQEVTQYENNLGFFANSKGANAMKDEVVKKIEHTKRKIEEITRKIKMIPNEINQNEKA
jgi:hypothetical protein